MRALRWIALIVIGMLTLFIVGGLLLPSAIEVERSTVIEVPAPLVHRAVTDFEIWQQWDPWGRTDDTMTVSFGEIRRGQGAIYHWRGDHTGTGSVEILEATGEAVDYRYVFNENEEMPAFARMLLQPVEEARTHVTWTFNGEVGANPIDRVLVLFIRPMIESSYEDGLAALKALLEQPVRNPED